MVEVASAIPVAEIAAVARACSNPEDRRLFVNEQKVRSLPRKELKVIIHVGDAHQVSFQPKYSFLAIARQLGQHV